MSDENRKNGLDDEARDDAAETVASALDDVAAENEVEAPAPEPDPIERLEAENADLRDRFLRLAADMDNLRRRTERELKDAKAYAVTGFARDMLTVCDNLRRALDTVSTEQRDSENATVKTILEGVELTERSMLSTLERHGVKKIDAEGEKFDPNFHQAMFEIPNPAVPNNTVVQVVQAGYSIGDRVLRPAMVGVAKGGPKDAVAETSETR